MAEARGDSRKNSLTQTSQLIGIAFSIPWTILAMTLLGNYADKRYGTAPWLMLTGLFGGLLGAFFEGMVIAKRLGAK